MSKTGLEPNIIARLCNLLSVDIADLEPLDLAWRCLAGGDHIKAELPVPDTWFPSPWQRASTWGSPNCLCGERSILLQEQLQDHNSPAVAFRNENAIRWQLDSPCHIGIGQCAVAGHGGNMHQGGERAR